MKTIPRIIPAVAWLAAALIIFPFFAPNGYNALLFGGRLAGAMLFLILAVLAFRKVGPPVAQLIASIAAVGAGYYVSNQGFNLIRPSAEQVLAIIRDGLEKQGPETVAEYADLKITDSRCKDWPDVYGCFFNLSYKLASTGKTYEEKEQYIRYSKQTGEMPKGFPEGDSVEGCGFEFQWTQKLRATANYAPYVSEPISWLKCETNAENTAYRRRLFVNGDTTGVESLDSLHFVLPKTDKAAPLTLEPLSLADAEQMAGRRFGREVKANSVKCDASNPLEIRCNLSGTYLKRDIMGIPASDFSRPPYRETVSVVPQGSKWVVK